MMTGLTSASFDNIQTDAGLFVVGIDPAEYMSGEVSAFEEALRAAIGNDETCLGATRGGGTFTVTKENRTVEADGVRYNFKGGTRNDSLDGQLTTTLIEMTPGNIVRTFGAADKTKTGKFTKVQPRTQYKDSDYIDTLMWIGDTNYGFMAIVLKNALNTADFNLTFTDKGEATLPVEFHAHQENVMDAEEAPFAMYLIEKTEG